MESDRSVLSSIAEIDADHDGAVTSREFEDYVWKHVQKKIDASFYIDRNKPACLSQFREVMNELNDAEVRFVVIRQPDCRRYNAFRTFVRQTITFCLGTEALSTLPCTKQEHVELPKVNEKESTDAIMTQQRSFANRRVRQGNFKL